MNKRSIPNNQDSYGGTKGQLGCYIWLRTTGDGIYTYAQMGPSIFGQPANLIYKRAFHRRSDKTDKKISPYCFSHRKTQLSFSPFLIS